MPSVYYLKNSLQPDLKLCMDSACRIVEGKPFHKTMVGHLFQTVMTRYTCGFFPRILAIIPATRYTCVFLSRILAFYSQVYDHFLTNAHIYAYKKPIYMRYKQACDICGRRKSSYKRHRIIPSAKNPLMYDGVEK